MNIRTKVGAYLLGLAAVFLGSLGIGDAVEPLGPAAERPDAPVQTGVDHDDMDMGGDAGK
ncbi:hypothetical protein [Candidatus Blastococcus massiliensis]|uniref:hypothetical protein n=1 Tax=Candidatus Blastococcus massiliensis TaxID=1470358 RepID=UPI0004B5FD3D|nr:hypothetical protein [Candidatus Blastococcus massiliensis]